MNAREYTELREELTQHRLGISAGKREDYTKGSDDVLKNFKNQAEAFGIDPKVSLGVHMEKQFSAVLNYIKTNGQSESEPIKNRISDTLNYLELLWGLINDEEEIQSEGDGQDRECCDEDCGQDYAPTLTARSEDISFK